VFGQDSEGQSGVTPLRVPPTAASQALKTFRLQPGFRMELVACEPLIRDPVAMDFDAHGRMYVVEYPEFNAYSFGESVAVGGAVKLLTDADGDGRYERASLFLDKVAFPTAVACYDGGVFVGAAPDVLYCKDTDGDGRADIREVVLTGFGRDFAGGGLLNSFHWGLDHRFHLATGFAGGQVRSVHKPDIPSRSVRSRGILLDPRNRTFELTSGGGQHGLAVDDWGRKFLCSNVNPMLMLMYDTRYIARNPLLVPPAAAVSIHAEGAWAPLFRISPLEPWRVLRARQVAANAKQPTEGGRSGGLFTSSSGITVYRGDAWPKRYRGGLFIGEVANNLVYRARLEPDGVGLVARRADPGREFLASRDIWFRPVQFANGPDGNLYVVDMYRELIEGAAFVPPQVLKQLDPASGTDRGRIYRIVYEADAESADNTPAQQRRRTFRGADTEQLVAALAHANGWHRDTASRLLYERGDPAAVSSLKRLSARSDSALGRMHALWTLQALNGLEAADLLPRLQDRHPRVREHALRLAGTRGLDSPELRAEMFKLSGDRDPRVRYQLAFSLGNWSGPWRERLLADLLIKGRADVWMRTAVQSSLARGAAAVVARTLLEPEFRQSDAGRTVLVSLAAQIGARNRNSEVATLLKSLRTIPDSERRLKQMLLRGLLTDAAPQLRQQLADSDGNALLADLIRTAHETAVNTRASVPDRVEAIRLLVLDDVDAESLTATLAGLLNFDQPPRVQTAVITALGRLPAAAVGDAILRAWPGLSPQLRKQATEVLFSRPAWTVKTLQALQTGRISRGEISTARLKILQQHADADIRRRVRTLGDAGRQPRRQTVIDDYQQSLQLPGDVGRGRALFGKLCAQCHRLDGVGVSVGANLAGIAGRDSAAVLINILDPNRDVKPVFVNYTLVTSDGRTLSGMLLEDTVNSVTIRQNDGRNTRVLRTNIRVLRGTGLSFMPEGLERQLDYQAMSDLLVYLRQVK